MLSFVWYNFISLFSNFPQESSSVLKGVLCWRFPHGFILPHHQALQISTPVLKEFLHIGMKNSIWTEYCVVLYSVYEYSKTDNVIVWGNVICRGTRPIVNLMVLRDDLENFHILSTVLFVVWSIFSLELKLRVWLMDVDAKLWRVCWSYQLHCLVMYYVEALRPVAYRNTWSLIGSSKLV